MRAAIGYQPDLTPVLELAADELIFPVKVEQGGAEYVALFHMRPYGERELIDFLDERAGEFTSKGRARLIIEPSTKPGFTELFDRYFVRLGGVEGDPSIEQQKAWLARHERLKQRVIQEGYGGGEILAPENEGVPHLHGLRLADITANRIAIGCTLWCEETSRAERVTVTHVLRAETPEDNRKYAQATGRLENYTRKGTWKVLIDHAALCSLYDSMVEEVSGYVLDGAPCSPENKAAWLTLIPVWHKVAVIQEVFAGGSVKNG